MKRAIPILLILALAGSGYYYFYYKPQHETPPGERTELRLSGNIEAHETVLSFKVQGRISQLDIQEGQWLDAGAEVARLKGEDIRQQAVLDEAAVRTREAELNLALAGSRKQEIAAFEQSVADAEADVEQRKIDVTRADQLYKRDAGPKQTLDQAQTALKRSQATLQRAKEQLAQAREGTRAEQITVNRTNLVQAQERLRLSELNVGYTVLTAPSSGVILVRHAELGEIVTAGTPVATLADLDHVWLRAYIPETDLGRVKWGQEASITTDTFAGKTYRGRISFIASKAEFTPKSIETHRERVTLVYRVKVDVDNPNRDLKPGMPADATVRLQ
jgi:HlyD family secretion protein